MVGVLTRRVVRGRQGWRHDPADLGGLISLLGGRPKLWSIQQVLDGAFELLGLKSSLPPADYLMVFVEQKCSKIVNSVCSAYLCLPIQR